MLQAHSRRIQRVLGVRQETVTEIVAILVLMFGLLLLLSLASQAASGANLIGRFGAFIFNVLTFVFGKYVAYLIPVLTLAWGVQIWRGDNFHKVPVRILGIFIASVSICALVSISHAETDLRTKQEGFRVGGAVGNFLMHRDCMYLKGYVGVAGCYLLFGGLFIISMILITDSVLRPLLLHGVQRVRTMPVRELAGKFAFWRNWTISWVEEDEEETPASSSLSPVPVAQPLPPGAGHVEHRASAFTQSIAASAAAASPVHPAVPMAPPQPERVRTPDHVFAAGAPHKSVIPPPPPVAVTDADDLVSLAEATTRRSEPYVLPRVEILNPVPKVEHRISREEIEEVSEILERTLSEFGISAQVVQVTQGPTVTRFELQPAPGVKVARIASLENDIAMCMRAESVRIIAPIPGKAAVGLEVPNRKPAPVFLRELLSTDVFQKHGSPLAFALGKTISGEPYICDLAAMPHLLIAGTTGSGKSVCLNSIICSILFRMSPEQVKFIMIDPKRVELNVYQAIPHLLAPVVCEARKAAAALQWAIEQMEDRYKKLAALGVRNIDGYNAIVRSAEPHPKAIGRQLDYMPHIVIVVDELADLMLIARNEVEDSIIRLAQMSRAVGMHLIIATQRPSVNVITGIIKANFPSRVAFQVSSKVDSRTILDTNGAEALLGRGDMLFSPGGSPKPNRLQGCYLSDAEVERVADYVRGQQMAQYLKQDFAERDKAEAAEATLRMNGVDADDSAVAMPGNEGADDVDYSYQQQRADGKPIAMPSSGSSSHEDGEAIDEELFRQAVKTILVHKKASVSLLQRRLKVGFARAGRLMDMMEEAGIVGPNVGSKVREILVDIDEYLKKLESEEEDRF